MRSILETGSVDLVTCAQAFHWFDNEPSVAEIARLLRQGGTLALVWNVRDDGTPWVKALSVMIEQYAGDTPRHATGRWRWILNDPRFVLDKEIVQEHPPDGPAGCVRACRIDEAMSPIFRMRRRRSLNQDGRYPARGRARVTPTRWCFPMSRGCIC